MPDQPPDEFQKLIAKIAVYSIGTILGIAAKLATLNKEKALTMKDVLFHSIIAFATAYLVWWMLDGKVSESLLISISVVIGRFGDVILLAVGKGIKNFILQTINKDL